MIASVIVNYNSAGYVRRLLSSRALEATSVVVVDNGSEPDEIAALCREHAATPLMLPTNVGFAAGVNRGLDALPPGASEVLLVNPDVTLGSGEVAALHEALDACGADAVCPLILSETSGGIQGGNGGGPLTLLSLAAYFWFLARLSPGTHGLFLNRSQLAGLAGPTRLHWLSMACVLVRRSALDRFGRLPEDEFMYGEDIAWGTRATAAGARLMLVPSVTVTHLGGASGASTYDAAVGPLTRLIARRMPPVRARAGALVVATGLRARRLAGLPVARNDDNRVGIGR